MNTFVSPSHLSVSQAATTVLDSQESQQGGNASRVKRAEEFVKARKTEPKKTQVQAELKKTDQKPELEKKQALKPVAEQVDANELSASVALKGSQGERNRLPKELNKKILKAMVPNADGLYEILCLSLKEQVTNKENMRSKIDFMFPEDKEMQGLLNLTVLEIVLEESQRKNMPKEEMVKMNVMAEKIYATHQEYIDMQRENILDGLSFAKESRMSVKQSIKIYQAMDVKEDQVAHGFLPFIKMIIASSPNNTTSYMNKLRKKLSLIISRENTKHDSALTKQRSHIIQARLSFLNHALQMVDDYKRVLTLIDQKGK